MGPVGTGSRRQADRTIDRLLEPATKIVAVADTTRQNPAELFCYFPNARRPRCFTLIVPRLGLSGGRSPSGAIPGGPE